MDVEPQYFDMRDLNGWGNNVSWWSEPGDKIKRVYAHTMKRPQIGDFVLSPMQSGRAGKFVIVELDRKHDPSDMWFATVEFAGYHEAKVEEL